MVNNMVVQKIDKKIALGVKIPASLDARLKRARQAAKEKGMVFNVSSEIEKFLLKELKRVEKVLDIEQDINEEKNQLNLLDK